jgi:hypothetical protein
MMGAARLDTTTYEQVETDTTSTGSAVLVVLIARLTFVVAIRQALDYASFNRALAVCFLGWLIHGLLFFAFVMVAI